MEGTKAANSTNDHMKSPRYEDPSAKIWNAYLSEAERYDNALAHKWKSDMDAILIFAGLFSASVTAFLVESYRNLIPDTDDKMILLLSQISEKLSVIANGDQLAATSLPVATEPFSLPATALVCNILWYLSLSFSLLCALFATLVQQWTRNYIQASGHHSTPQRRARISAFLYQGLDRFKMMAVVEIIPFLLHLSLLFFLAGLFAYLLAINDIVAYLILGILVACTVIYTLITLLPTFCLNCPYRTPLSPLTWNILRTLRLIHYRDATGRKRTVEADMGMKDAREHSATEISSERDERDFSAMCWTLESLRDDNALESFVEVIPKVVASTDYSAKLLLHRLLGHDSVTIRLGYRIPRLLMSCMDKQLRAENAIAQKRATTCLSAIWSLTMMSLPRSQAPVAQNLFLSRETLRFDEQTLKHIDTTGKEVSGISDFTISARAVVARTLLDMHLDQLLKLEMEVLSFIRTRRWSPERLELHKVHVAQTHSHLVLKRIRVQLLALEDSMFSQRPHWSGEYMRMDAIRQYLEELVDAAASSSDKCFIESMVYGTLNHIRVFRSVLNQAGFHLTSDFVSRLSRRPHELPYEAANTLRRLFLQINPERESPFSVPSQTSFAAALDDALSLEIRLPESIANLLLGILVRGVISDPSCAVKAKSVVQRYIQVSKFDAANEAAWYKAVDVLEDVTGVSTTVSPESPTLDIFRFHMYTDTRLDSSSKSVMSSRQVLIPSPDVALSAPRVVLQGLLKARDDRVRLSWSS
ncbi:hypothetical protein BDZ89DRAFT_228097 [Hymenopellis radicata]|nr:hypothetical protein BDZ89DRAFT_228097 [Hymenopellis radicata]